MRMKKPKTKEQKTAEAFFPVEASEIKHLTEKKEKDEIVETKFSIEKVYKGRDNPIEIVSKTKVKKIRVSKSSSDSKFPVKKTTRFTRRIIPKEYFTPKIKLKENSYELIITEKPQAAMKIASALGESEKRNFKGIPYYEVDRE